MKCKNGGDVERKSVLVMCVCHKVNLIYMTGNNNADGKGLCDCGRHVTVHLRRRKK